MGDVVFFSRSDRPPTKPAPIGDGTAPIFEERFVDGVRTLVETGRQPLNEFVQASLEDTKIYNIISRYQRGDESALNKVVGQYMDVVGMPTNLAEAQNALINIERNFNKLPAELKEKFNNNVNEFVQVVSTGKLADVMNEFNNDSAPVTSAVKDGDVSAE